MGGKGKVRKWQGKPGRNGERARGLWIGLTMFHYLFVKIVCLYAYSVHYNLCYVSLYPSTPIFTAPQECRRGLAMRILSAVCQSVLHCDKTEERYV